MCTNVSTIYNRYIKKNIYVNCGKCPACLQSKAFGRSARIRNTVTSDTYCLFVTLTYDNHFVPYIDTNDLDVGKNYDVPIYRDAVGRYTRMNRSYCFSFNAKQKRVRISSIPYIQVKKSDLRFNTSRRRGLSALRGKSINHVGVCYYPDSQNFLKRLRQILVRNYGFTDSFSYFCCSEYGARTKRPHFHFLFFIPKDSLEVFRLSVVKAWPFADRYRTLSNIEIARDCANYVSSYVNCGHGLSDFYKNNFIRQKHSYSKVFGMSLPSFSLDSILEKVKQGDLHYIVERFIQGYRTNVNMLIPQYVINRFFPLFKGYSRLTCDSIFELLQRPDNLSLIPECHEIGYTNGDWYKLKVMLDNSFLRYHSLTGNDRFQYALDYIRTWNLYRSSILRESLEFVSPLEFLEFYDNSPSLAEYLLHPECFQSLSNLSDCIGLDYSEFNHDINTFSSRVLKTRELEQIFEKYSKERKVNDIAMSYMFNN